MNKASFLSFNQTYMPRDTYNFGHNILELYVLVQIRVTTSKTKCDI